jgi:hypothetical protein
MRRTLIALTLLALAIAGGAAVAAQDQAEECPAQHVCVDYGKNDTFAIDPAQGFYQAIVVAERDLTIRDFDGTRTTRKVTLAGFVADGDTFTLEGEHTVERAGQFANAELGDVFVLAEVE